MQKCGGAYMVALEANGAYVQQRVQSLRQGEADKEDLAEKKQALVARLEKSLGSKVNTAQPSEYLEKLYSVAGNVEPSW